VVVRSSRDDHMILEGCYIPGVMGGCTDWGSDSDLGCDGMRPNGSSWVLLGPNSWAEQHREVLRGVSEVTGPKYGD